MIFGDPINTGVPAEASVGVALTPKEVTNHSDSKFLVGGTG